MFSLWPSSQSPGRALAIASGTVGMITRGWMQLSNWAAGTRNTTTRPKAKTNRMPPLDSLKSWDWPLKSI